MVQAVRGQSGDGAFGTGESGRGQAALLPLGLTGSDRCLTPPEIRGRPSRRIKLPDQLSSLT